MSVCKTCHWKLTEFNWYPSCQKKCDYSCKRCIGINNYQYRKNYYRQNKERMLQCMKVYRNSKKLKLEEV